METHFLQLQTAGIGALHQGPDHQNGGDALGNGGSQSHTGHIHVENGDKNHIQHHVDHAGKTQIHQRTSGITGSPQNGGAVVVHHGESDAREVDLHVQGRKGQHRIRGAHPVQEGAGEGDADDGQHHTADQSGGQGRMDGVVDHGIFPAAQGVGHRNTGTHGKTYEEIDHQIGDGTGGTHGSHTDTAAETADDHQIGSVEQQLQKAGQDDGDGIQDNVGQQRPGKHAVVQTLHEEHLLDQDFIKLL